MKHSISGNFGTWGGSLELGYGDYSVLGGKGGRYSLNPFESFDLFSYTSKTEGRMTYRSEVGIYINSELVELAVTLSIVLGPGILAIIAAGGGQIGAGAGVAISILMLINNNLKTDSCDLGKN